jgi:hypothetical protein
VQIVGRSLFFRTRSSVSTGFRRAVRSSRQAGFVKLCGSSDVASVLRGCHLQTVVESSAWGVNLASPYVKVSLHALVPALESSGSYRYRSSDPHSSDLSESDALGFTLATMQHVNTYPTPGGPMGAVLSVLLRRITDLRIHPPPSPSHAPTR